MAERHFKGTDPGPVVLDEVLGMLITLFMNPVGWMGPPDRIRAVPRGGHHQAVPREQARSAAWRLWNHGRRRHGRRLLEPRAPRRVADRGAHDALDAMKAWIFAVGSEMLTPFRVDTNSLTITERLNAIGCDVRMKAVVGDDVDELCALFQRGVGDVDLIVCTGGLGPTEDDITRDALARALRPAVRYRRTDCRTAIRTRFEQRGLVMQEINRRQAWCREARLCSRTRAARRRACGSNGKAPALLLLPGPPREMLPMLERSSRNGSVRRPAPRPVPPGAEDHRPPRVGRGRSGTAGVRQVGVGGDSDRDDHSRQDGSDRTAPDRRCAECRRCRRRP